MAKETVFGTAVTPTSYVPFSGVTLESDPGLFFPPVVMGVRDTNVFALQGEFKRAGDVSGPFYPTNGAQLLVAAIGTDAVTGAGPTYTHTISQANTLPSLTIEKNIGGAQSLQFAGCRVGKYSLKVSAGDSPAEFSTSIIAKTANILDTPSGALTYVNESPFVFAEASLNIMDTTANYSVTSVSLDIDNGLKPTYTFNGSHDLEFLTPLTRKISGSINVVFDSLDDTDWGYYSKMMNGVQGSLVFTLIHTSGNALTITLNQINLSKYSDDVKLEDVVMSTLDFEASYSLSQTNTITAVLINTHSTAY